jgi:hypothetical protein
MPRMNTRCLPPEHPNMLGSYNKSPILRPNQGQSTIAAL